MSVIKVVFLTLSLTLLAFGFILHSPPSINPEYPERCWIENLNRTIRGGETWTNRENCVKYICSADDFSYIAIGCGVASVDPPCYLKEGDKTKDYPQCCPQNTCE